MPNHISKTPPYGNIQVRNIDGLHIFNCGYKKAQWYLKKNLATIIQDIPLIIQLTFIANGNGRAEDPYYLQERANICVVCGSDQTLTRHHIVPVCYRSWFDECVKDNESHDILPLCYSCHESYEYAANELKRELNAKYEVAARKYVVADKELRCAVVYAHTLLEHTTLPQERIVEIETYLRSFCDKRAMSYDLEVISKINCYEYNKEKSEYQEVAEKVDVEKFVKLWRQHFITHTSPRHLPAYWDVNRKVKVGQ